MTNELSLPIHHLHTPCSYYHPQPSEECEDDVFRGDFSAVDNE